MERLPFATGTFDVVYSRHSLEHSSDLGSSLSEIRRVLRPGGTFIFCVPARLDDTEEAHMTRWPGRQWLAACWVSQLYLSPSCAANLGLWTPLLSPAAP